MIKYLWLGRGVMVPEDWRVHQEFRASAGWNIARLGPKHFRLSRQGNDEQNIRAIPEFEIDGIECVTYEGQVDDPNRAASALVEVVFSGDPKERAKRGPKKASRGL